MSEEARNIVPPPSGNAVYARTIFPPGCTIFPAGSVYLDAQEARIKELEAEVERLKLNPTRIVERRTRPPLVIEMSDTDIEELNRSKARDARIKELEVEAIYLRQMIDGMCTHSAVGHLARLLNAANGRIKELEASLLAESERAEMLAAEAEKLQLRLTELRHTFDLRWKADLRAIERWREGHPERELVRPDHTDLVVWLLEKNERLRIVMRWYGDKQNYNVRRAANMDAQHVPIMTDYGDQAREALGEG